ATETAMKFDIDQQHFWRAIKSPLAHFATALTLLLFTCAVTIGIIVGQWNDLSDAQEGLARLERRAPATQLSTDVAAPPGSPFLEGDSATLASASLLQRITSLFTQVGGTVASSEVDPQNGSTKDGWLKVS